MNSAARLAPENSTEISRIHTSHAVHKEKMKVAAKYSELRRLAEDTPTVSGSEGLTLQFFATCQALDADVR